MIQMFWLEEIFMKLLQESPNCIKVWCRFDWLAGAQSIFENNLFNKLCEKIRVERLDIQVSILKTCYNCIRMGNTQYMPAIAIDCHALDIFSEVAKNSKIVEVQVAACDCIMMLWYLSFSSLFTLAFFMNAKKLHLIQMQSLFWLIYFVTQDLKFELLLLAV